MATVTLTIIIIINNIKNTVNVFSVRKATYIRL